LTLSVPLFLSSDTSFLPLFNAALFKGEREREQGGAGEMKEEHSSTNQPVSFRFLEGKERSFSEIHTLETRKKKAGAFPPLSLPFFVLFSL
jgi:hypothetical protein